MKVTDRRMFTPDGRLREEYAEEYGAAGERDETEAAPSAEEATPAAPPEPARAPEPAPLPKSPPLELPGTPPGLGAPTFFDLVAVLAEPVSLYLGDLELPDGTTAENLEMARLHIDLLDVLRRKTSGNLTAQELAVVDDLLYRLRLRYVQKRG